MDGIGEQFLEGTKYQNMGKSATARGCRSPRSRWTGIDKDADPPAKTSGHPAWRHERPGGDRGAAQPPVRMRPHRWPGGAVLSALVHPGGAAGRVRDPDGADGASAGARHAFETLLLINNVSGLDPASTASWPSNMPSSKRTWLRMRRPAGRGCLGQEFIKSCAATFIWTAEVARMKYRYGERGYRYLHLDAGHVCQNLYLAAEAIGCGRARCRLYG